MGLLVRVAPIVAYMMEDESTVVVKRLLSAVIQLYRLAVLVSCSNGGFSPSSLSHSLSSQGSSTDCFLFYLCYSILSS